MNIIIQNAKPTDAAALIEFFKQVGKETDNLSFGEEGISINVDAETEYIAQIENSHDNIMLVAKYDEKIIGTASLNRLPRRMCHRGDLSVSVAKEYWNHGIGSQLLKEIINFAKNSSFEMIDLQVRSDNYAAIHLYEKYGFKKICTYLSFFKIGNQYIDFDYMVLNLLAQ